MGADAVAPNSHPRGWSDPTPLYLWAGAAECCSILLNSCLAMPLTTVAQVQQQLDATRTATEAETAELRQQLAVATANPTSPAVVVAPPL